MKKLVKFRLGLCAIELVFGIVLLCMEAGFQRKYQYFGVTEVVTYGSFTIIQAARLVCAFFLEFVPNDIDLVWTRTGMVLYTVSGWVQVVECKHDLDRAGLGFIAAFIFLFDQTVFFLNHPIPEWMLEPPPEETTCEEEKAAADSVQQEQNNALLEEKGNCVRRAVAS
ncbi:uncharacterized protein LOC126457454 isoform X2 [Schistocerca serialis cubense]|uniref:uncharacterized protein LOC126457454 isoform X2 n=1 Tax=Schistocerca serialis cubense TaxID=2023355 RepID=UPI00214E3509|nr:uncharacterized protein LOC126457454 isoform X2 [Schistocerca serialis cubense]